MASMALSFEKLDERRHISQIYNWSSEIFDFEKEFDYNFWRSWIDEHWLQSVNVALLYVVIIFGLQYFMKGRQEFQLKSFLFVWNLLLAIFSLIASYRVVKVAAITINSSEFGLWRTICDPQLYTNSTFAGVWGALFVFSKELELIDTIFLVLRKKKLIFLHWYHHIITMIYSAYTYKDFSTPGFWFMTLNYTVHAIMYSYYAFMAIGLGKGLVKRSAMLITTLQILQMVVGLGVCYYAYSVKAKGYSCNASYPFLMVGTFMYISFFLLFGQLFLARYFSKSTSKVQKRE